jgi:hypothetical protein
MELRKALLSTEQTVSANNDRYEEQLGEVWNDIAGQQKAWMGETAPVESCEDDGDDEGFRRFQRG